LALTSPKIDQKLACLQMVARRERQPGQLLVLIGDKNFRGKDFETELAALDTSIQRPRRIDAKPILETPSTTTATFRPAREITPQPAAPDTPYEPHHAPIRQRIESIFWTFKDILTLQRHGARTLGQPPHPTTRTVRRARRRDHAQPPTRPPQPQPRQLHSLTPWH